MLDAVAVGEVFSSPPAQAFYDAIVAADTGAGVACLIGNYAGDVMNVRMAIDMAADDGIDARLVVATDDVASAPKESAGRRHGIAGGFFVWKCAGARAAEGASLDEVVATAERAVAATRSICVGLAPCTIPAVGRPNFSIEPGTMEFGVGHHGETGIRTEPMSDAGKVSGLMATTILDDAGFDGARRLAVMLSGLGGTPSMELYVLFDGVERVLAGAGHRVERAYLGDVVTSLDMNGASLTVVELDDELDRLLDAPATAVGLKLY
jgi:dihydroxyacetone kinase-like protein